MTEAGRQLVGAQAQHAHHDLQQAEKGDHGHELGQDRRQQHQQHQAQQDAGAALGEGPGFEQAEAVLAEGHGPGHRQAQPDHHRQGQDSQQRHDPDDDAVGCGQEGGDQDRGDEGDHAPQRHHDQQHRARQQQQELAKFRRRQRQERRAGPIRRQHRPIDRGVEHRRSRQRHPPQGPREQGRRLDQRVVRRAVLRLPPGPGRGRQKREQEIGERPGEQCGRTPPDQAHAFEGRSADRKLAHASPTPNARH